MQDFRKLAVWERSHLLTLEIYAVMKRFPADERFGLTSQLRRGAASIPANIAEGCGRDTAADMARFLQIAMGSASELHYHLMLARDLDLLSSRKAEETLHEVMESRECCQGCLTVCAPPPRPLRPSTGYAIQNCQP
jgi:four helix bundle protein